ncbi:hypothetical protein GCM10025865_24240 [Paraoerskovia sediminicola]|uniref:Aldehyde dehydrogenase domain-containing protein n=1 Tax=Paraoerskovia sediminicola TaxID=1138587 RepID=A0ABM8G503_9CELL|nr:hypothetical protein GCM10025865_24240 [Paraoerskovia sediminicola]
MTASSVRVTPGRPSSTAGRPSSVTDASVARLLRRLAASSDTGSESSAGDGTCRRTVTTVAPMTGDPVAELPLATAGDVVAAQRRAREAQAIWAGVPVRRRAQVLLRFHDLVLERQDEALDLIQWENGKVRRDAHLEVLDVANTARYYARRAPGLLAPSSRRGVYPVLTKVVELHRPVGVVGVISPWNYPLSLAVGDTLPALVAGNAVVQKVDTQTALTALWSAELMDEAGLPADLWQLVVGEPSDLGDALVGGSDFVMFTGSTAAGRRIARQAGSSSPAARSSSGARTRCWCSTTPTSPRPSRERCAPASRPRASCACRSSACTSRTRSTTRSCPRS